jgi:hypothetical protein
MSGWGLGWFGGGQAKKEAPKKAILQLRGQLEMLNKREKHLQNQMDEQDTIARKYVSSNKNGNLHPRTSTPGNNTNTIQQRQRQRYGGRSSLNTLSSKRARKS